MGHKEGSYEQYYEDRDRRQMTEDLRALRELAEEQALQPDRSPGPYEMNVNMNELKESIEEARRADERAAEQTAELVEAAEQQNRLLREQAQEERGTRVVIEQLRDIGSAQLLMTGVVALATVKGANHLDYICDTLDDIYLENVEANSHLEHIEKGVWQANEWLEGISAQLTVVRDEMINQGELTRDEMINQGELTRDEMINQGNRTIRVLALTAERIVQVLDHCVEQSTRHIIESQCELSDRQEKASDARHTEIVEILRSPLRMRADERYRQACLHFKLGELTLCIQRLKEALADDSTHAMGFLLLARALASRGLTAEAKTAYKRAAKYARENKNLDAYILATTRLSHLQRMVGNYKKAHDVLVEAKKSIDVDSPHFLDVVYEELKARWVLATTEKVQKNEKASAMVSELKGLFRLRPDLRKEVAQNPLWKELREIFPAFRFSNHAYLRLADTWHHLREQGDSQIRVICGKDLVLMPSPLDPEMTFDESIDLAIDFVVEGTEKGVPKTVTDHLDWLQAQTLMYVLQKRDKTLVLKGEDFLPGHEALILYAYEQLALRGRKDDARLFLRWQDRKWNIWMPELANLAQSLSH